MEDSEASVPPRVVAVLGGNAFVPPDGNLTMARQFRFAREALSHLQPLLGADVQLVLGHGNGPQVGHMLARVEQSLGEAYALPLEVCVAESEGELGYVLLQCLHNLLSSLGSTRPVASLLTQVRVDADDPAFEQPDKPIGPVYGAARAQELRARGFAMAEDAGRGLRRVVPSPRPLEVIEAEVIDRLLSMGVIVIAAGGGGIPVVREGGALKGVDAVVDKDLTAALLADVIGAELLVILTGVPCAYLGFGSAQQVALGRVTPAQVRAYAGEGHFPAGSMGPKMEAAASFAERPGRRAIICDPASLPAALAGRAGTLVSGGSA
ncbi:MAG: carbamate kinase [Myxococcales bacterium]|nr:carbamate kinase [Myxococcales bacterium]